MATEPDASRLNRTTGVVLITVITHILITSSKQESTLVHLHSTAIQKGGQAQIKLLRLALQGVWSLILHQLMPLAPWKGRTAFGIFMDVGFSLVLKLALVVVGILTLTELSQLATSCSVPTINAAFNIVSALFAADDPIKTVKVIGRTILRYEAAAQVQSKCGNSRNVSCIIDND